MKDKNRQNRYGSCKGFTLIEAMLATSLLAMCAAGALLPFTSGASLQAEGITRTAASMLAADMMQRVELTTFSNIISTYNGYTEQQGQLTDSANNIYTDLGYSKFSRQVSCEQVYMPQQSDKGTQSFILIKVKVFYNDREVIEIKKLKGRQ